MAEPNCDGKTLSGHKTAFFLFGMLIGTPAGPGDTPPASEDYEAAETEWSKAIRITKITPPGIKRAGVDAFCMEDEVKVKAPVNILEIGDMSATLMYMKGDNAAEYFANAIRTPREYGAWIRYKNGTADFFRCFCNNFEPEEVTPENIVIAKLDFTVNTLPVDTKPSAWPALTAFNDFAD